MSAPAIDADAALRLVEQDAVIPDGLHPDVEKALAAEVRHLRAVVKSKEKVISQYRQEVAVANRNLEPLGFPPVAFPDGWPTCAGVKAG
jgi:hypothetical protein